MLSRVSSGVALGVSELRTFCSDAYCTSSKMSGRLRGSPPVSTKTGTSIAEISSMRRFASAVVSSWELRKGCAQARQATQARSHAWVVSQMAMKGRSSKFVFPCMLTPRSHNGLSEHYNGRPFEAGM